MSNPLIHEKKEPLSYGYLIDDKLGFKVAFDFIGTLCFENPVGKSLVDFAWIDPQLVDTIFNQVFATYMLLCQKKNDYGFIAEGLIYFIERSYMRMNCYFSMYLFGFIEFLLEGRADQRLLSNVAADSFAREGYFVCSDTDELFPLEKRDFIYVFLQSITERQALVEHTLEKVLGSEHKLTQDAIARFYEYESNDALFREHWHSRFEVSFGVLADNQPEVVQLSALSRIDDMLRYELVQMLTHDVKYKSCQSCGKLFIPSGRSDSLYCDRIMPEQDKPCKQIGANLVSKKKAEFDEWKKQALPKRKACENGEMTIEAFVAWLDETSRQK